MKKGKKSNRKAHSDTFWKMLIFIVFAAFVMVTAMTVMYALNYKPNVGDASDPFETLYKYHSIGHGGDENAVKPDESGQQNQNEDNLHPVIDDHSRVDDMYTFLVVGRDRVALNTDVIMLVSYNVSDGEIAIMQIPRDTYIEVNGKPYRINAVYASFYNTAKRMGAQDPFSDAMVGFAETLQKNMYIKIDYWALFNLEGFCNIIDIIGGVEIDVPFDMSYDDPYQDLHINITKGQQTLNGEQAEHFVRYRSGYIQADIGRVNAQKIFISALAKQLQESLSVKTVPKLITETIKNVTTSLSAADSVYFAKSALSVDTSNMVMLTLPGGEARAEVDSGAWYYIMHRADTLKILNRYFNVFISEITDEVFDSKQAFNYESRAHINKIYNTPSSQTAGDLVHSVKDINDDSIDIPLIK